MEGKRDWHMQREIHSWIEESYGLRRPYHRNKAKYFYKDVYTKRYSPSRIRVLRLCIAPRKRRHLVDWSASINLYKYNIYIEDQLSSYGKCDLLSPELFSYH